MSVTVQLTDIPLLGVVRWGPDFEWVVVKAPGDRQTFLN